MKTISGGRERRLQQFGEPQLQDEWFRVLHNPGIVTQVERTRIINIIAHSKSRWIHLHGIPGLGKTTVLQQVSQHLQRLGQHCSVMWDPRGNSAISVDELIAQAELDPSEPFTVLIDDFDWFLEDGRAQQLFLAFGNNPQLRVITAGLDPFSIPQVNAGEPDATVKIEFISPSDLSFTIADAKTYCANAASKTTQHIPAMDNQHISAMLRSSAGMPVAVIIAVDRWYSTEMDKTEGFNFILTLQTLKRILESRFPRDIVLSGESGPASLLSFLPRFTEKDISCLIKTSPSASLLAGSMSLAISPDTVSVGGYKWDISAWGAFYLWHAGDKNERKRLASRLQENGNYPGAFDQYILAEDYQSAEQMLYTYFAEIYAEFSPEVEELLVSLPFEAIRGLPYLRFLILSLDNKADSVAMVSAAKRFKVIASQYEPAYDADDEVRRSMAFALSALANLHASDRHEALENARLAIDANAGSEGAFIATLVCFSCGIWPKKSVRFKTWTHHGRDRPRTLSLALLSLLTAPTIDQIEPPRGMKTENERSMISNISTFLDSVSFTATSYRFLIPIENQLIDEIHYWADDDGFIAKRVFDSAARSPLMLNELVRCARLLAVGNLAAAVKFSKITLMPPLTSQLVLALIALATGENDYAIRTLTMVDDDYGGGVHTLKLALLAAGFNRKGLTVQAKECVREACDIGFLGFAVAFLSINDINGLSTYDSRFATIGARVTALRLSAGGTSVSQIEPLSPRERDVLRLLKKGLKDKEISEALFISITTTKSHLQSISRKLGVRGRKNILRKAQELYL